MEPVKILKDLINFKTVNPPGNEYIVVDYVKSFFKKNKIKFKVFSKDQKRPNMIGYIGKGRPELFISCHSDTVPAGEGWKTNPFKSVIKNGRVYGRGTSDDKGPLACLISAVINIKKFEDKLKGTFIIGVLADEERGSDLGLKYLINEKKIKPDYAILPDVAGSMKKITVAEKGVLWLELTSFGKQVHGSMPQLGTNAVYNLIEVLDLIRKYKFKYKKHKFLSKPTLNLGQIEGGVAPNMVPSKAKAIIDIRYLPSQNPNKILNDIKVIIKKAQKKNKTIKIKIKVLEKSPATEVLPNNKLVKTIQKITKKILKIKPKITGLSGATDTKALVKKRIIAVGFSCGEHRMAHMANESIKIKELNDFTKVLTEIVKEFLS
ncbi:ArgE/DapE family deacylase [Candidatus Woesearchaeota archaeon]|nr:ArgE/DapE family deacylase [Candidatus Woesearchaeota archaeon]